MQDTAELYRISESTLYRALREHHRPKALSRSDFSKPRAIRVDEMEPFCEIMAAMIIRTSNKKGRRK